MAEPGTDNSSTATRLRQWQRITVATLFTGYAGYYICRSNLSVVSPLLLKEFQDQGLNKGHIGDIASFGVLFYALGKLVNGILADVLGGRRVFLIGLMGSVVCTVLFAYADRMAHPTAGISAALGLPVAMLFPMFVIWAANRFIQSMGWNGLVQITSWWFPPGRLATILGVLSTSYLIGDALARAYLGLVIRAGFDWRGVFLFAAGSLALIGVLTMIFLKQRPAHLGLPEPPPPPDNVYGTTCSPGKLTLVQLLKPLLSSYAFWLVCLMNIGLTLIRETFNLWNPTYLNEVAKLDPGVAAMTSLIFPLVGAASALLAGWLVDRLRGRYGLVVVPSLVGLMGTLIVMGRLPVEQFDPTTRTVVVLSLIAMVAFFLLAPYTFCSGILAVELGGQRGGGTSAGIIDTAGYMGATLAGSGIGRIAEHYGWAQAFDALAAVAMITLVFAAVYSFRGRRTS